MLMAGLLPLPACGDAAPLCGARKAWTVDVDDPAGTVPPVKSARGGVPTPPASSKPAPANRDGTVRSSSASRAGRARCGALRIGRATGRVNNWRIQDRVVMGRLLKGMEI